MTNKDEERKDTEETEMPAAKYFEGPIQWRDRIESLKDERQRLDADYQSRVSENESEIADLTSKLAAEGFALIGRISAKLDDLDAALPNHEADMSDWRNWKVGDSIVMLETIGETAEKDQVMIITWIDLECDLNVDDQPIRVVPEFDRYDGWWPLVDSMKWHSRPSK